MKASYNWLKKFVDFDISPKELAHAITMAGLEVEEIEELEGDTVFDIGITPNRPDCLSIRGIAREISAILELPLKDISVKVENEKGTGPVIKIKSPELCHRYSSRIITGVKPVPSPDWLARRLESCGIRATSNIVDVTNYVMLEIGQPLHAFDLDELSGKKIVVKQADEINTFITLDNKERKLNKDTLLIWDNEKPVAIAGVMGGQKTEVSESTNNILLESAYFKPASVRRTSKALNLSTESSYRFERGVDIDAVKLALDRAARLISEIAGGRTTHITDIYPTKQKRKNISVTFNKINDLIGVHIDESFVEKKLDRLGFSPRRAGETIVVTPPSFRDDLVMDVDVIEEIARLYGYNNIPSTLPAMHMSPAPEHRLEEMIKTLKTTFVKSGFSEVINYSFINPDALAKLKLPSDDIRMDLIYIKNPLRQEESAMRTSLVPALLDNVSMNLNHGERELRFFEISRVFLPSGDKLPKEVTQAGLIYHKDKTTSIWESIHEGLYDLKGTIENLFCSLKIEVAFVQDSTSHEPYLHPGKSCSIMIGNDRVGAIGALHPGVAGSFDITGDITIAEIYDIEKIMNAVPLSTVYVSLPKYPYVERDVALIVADNVSVSDVKNEILSIDSDIIESVNLFDVYQGNPIPEDKKSLAFGIRYRSYDRTLTDSEVDSLHAKIVRRLESNLKAELRS